MKDFLIKPNIPVFQHSSIPCDRHRKDAIKSCLFSIGYIITEPYYLTYKIATQFYNGI